MATVNIYDMADTWNASGTTFNAIMMDISNGSGGAPSYAAGSRAINIKRNGTAKFGVAVEGGIIQALEANFAALAVTGYSLTGSNATSMIDLAGTWNTTGAPSAIKLDITNTASNAAAKLLDLRVGGANIFSVGVGGPVYVGFTSSWNFDAQTNPNVFIFSHGSTNDFGISKFGYVVLPAASGLGWSSNSSVGVGPDLLLNRDAANTLAQRNGTNAQTIRLYATYTDASNGAWGFLDSAVTAAGTLTIGTSGNGTGASTLSKFQISLLGTKLFDYGVTTASTWTSAGTMAITSGSMTLGDWTSFFRWTGGTKLSTNGTDGHLLVSNSAGTDFTRMMFGGTTSSFPALKRSSTDLQVRLADDSGYAGLQLGSTSAALKVGTHSAIGAETVTGYITIKDSAGTDRKIAVVS